MPVLTKLFRLLRTTGKRVSQKANPVLVYKEAMWKAYFLHGMGKIMEPHD